MIFCYNTTFFIKIFNFHPGIIILYSAYSLLPGTYYCSVLSWHWNLLAWNFETLWFWFSWISGSINIIYSSLPRILSVRFHSLSLSFFKTYTRRKMTDETNKNQRTLVVSNLPTGLTEDDITIHFQSGKNGGGDVEKVVLFPDGSQAFVFFELESGKV